MKILLFYNSYNMLFQLNYTRGKNNLIVKNRRFKVLLSCRKDGNNVRKKKNRLLTSQNN